MEDLVADIDTNYHRSFYEVELDENGNVICAKKSNYRPKKVNTSSFRLQSFSWFGPKICTLIPNALKNINSLATFKDNLKKFEFENCPCKLCKEYVQSVGYIRLYKYI